MTIDQSVRARHAADADREPSSRLTARLQQRMIWLLRPHQGRAATQIRQSSAATLVAQLRSWRRILRMSGAVALAGGLVLAPIGASLAHAAAATARFVERSGPANPFDGVAPNSTTGGVSFADIDADSDLDAFIGTKGHAVYYFENTGTAIAPVYTERTGAANPLEAIATTPSDSPNFADLDADGDLDAVLANAVCFQNCPPTYESFAYYENTGTAAAPSFTLRTGAANPFTAIASTQLQTPELVDIDGDGDLDAFTLETDNSATVVAYYANTGTAAAPSFTHAANPFPAGTSNPTGTPTFTDIDGDGDMDAFVSATDNTINYFENTGAAAAPTFILRSGFVNPFEGIVITGEGSPDFADVDGDGDADGFVIGQNSTTMMPWVVFYENTGDAGVAVGGNAAEAGSAPGTFVITRNNPQLTGPITFAYTLGGTAALSSDYTLVGDNTLTFDATTITLADGVDSATLQVVPVDDRRSEGAETVTLTLTAAGDFIVDPAAAQLTIVDNDPINHIYLPAVFK